MSLLHMLYIYVNIYVCIIYTHIGCRSCICCIHLLSTPRNTQHMYEYINNISYTVECYPSTLLQYHKPLLLQTQYKLYTKLFTYLIITVDDTIQSI
jgi:hypothetical protein